MKKESTDGYLHMARQMSKAEKEKMQEELLKGCFYCLSGVEMSDNVQDGDIFLTKNKKNQYFIEAQSAPNLMSVPKEVRSIRIHHCPICGRDLDKDYEEYLKEQAEKH